MGFGDVKLMGMLGAFFGPWGALLNIIVASFFGAGVGIAMINANRSRGEDEKATYLPFGPYLAAGGLVVMFFGPEIIDLYMSFIKAPTALT